MSASVFLDTNVIVYAVDTTPDAVHKRTVARRLLLAGDFGLSAQVVQEFYVTATGKLKRPLKVATAARWVERLCRAEFIALDATLIKLAVAHSQRYRISYWDAANVAAAEALGAVTLYTEDLNHGQTYGNVRVENPFLDL